MPVSGLIALLDDIATIADDVATMASVAAQKGAAATKDVATLTTMAAKKTSGVVTDDMAVTAEQAIGIRREREIPVVFAVAKGSFKNKALFLVPGALVLNAVAPWAITPVLMAGGLFLAYEGVEKVLHKVTPHGDEEHAEEEEELPTDPAAFEALRVQGAIRTDLILSGEIIAISLGEVAAAPFATQVAALYGISVVMTAGVYGMVGALVKIDDFGELLIRRGGFRVKLGAAIVAGAPKLLHLISIVGTVAMLMVGGHILLEGIHPLEELVHHVVEAVPAWAHGVTGLALDVVIGAVAGLLVVGAMATGIPGRLWAAVKRPKR